MSCSQSLLLLWSKRVFHGFSLYHEGLLLLLQVINISLNKRSLLVSFGGQVNDKKKSYYGQKQDGNSQHPWQSAVVEGSGSYIISGHSLDSSGRSTSST